MLNDRWAGRFEPRVNKQQHVVAVLLHIELVMEDRFDGKVFADDEGVSPGETNEWPQDVVGASDAFVRVGDERKRHVKFASKAALGVEFVRAHADEICASERDFVEIIRKRACFASAVGRECFWEKIEDRAQSRLLGQDELRPLVCLGGYLGCPVTHFQRSHLDAVPS